MLKFKNSGIHNIPFNYSLFNHITELLLLYYIILHLCIFIYI